MAANKSIGAKHENMPDARGKGGFKSIKRLIGLLFKNYKGLLFVVPSEPLRSMRTCD